MLHVVLELPAVLITISDDEFSTASSDTVLKLTHVNVSTFRGHFALAIGLIVKPLALIGSLTIFGYRSLFTTFLVAVGPFLALAKCVEKILALR